MQTESDSTPFLLAETLARYALPFVSLASAVYVYHVATSPLNKIPGPFWASFTELWRTWKYYQGTWHDDIVQLHQKYGPVVRISPNEVSFVDKDALMKVYGHATGTRKTSWYAVWRPNPDAKGFFFTTDPKDHSFLRKRVSNAYSMSTVLGLEQSLQPLLDNVWVQFRKIAAEGRTIDMQDWANYFAFDVVTLLGVGEASGFVEKGSDFNKVIKAVHNVFFLNSITGYLPGQNSWVDSAIPRWIITHLRSEENPFVHFRNWMGNEIMPRLLERQQGEKNTDRRQDHLDRFMAMKERDGSPASIPSIFGEEGNLLGAGADTAAIGIAVIIGELMQHPEIHAKVRAEVDQAFEQTGQPLDYRTAESLPFLHASVKEATRLCPSILWQLPREAPQEGITIAGHYIPPEATLSMSPIAMNRCKEVFGEDADEFRPDRYFRDAEYVRAIEKYNVTFGYGSRTCVGKNLAMVEMHKFVGQFVREFDLAPVNKQAPFVRRSQWFCVHDKFDVKLSLRK